MKVVIVDPNHQIQRAEILSGGDEIERLEAQHGVDLICQRVATCLQPRDTTIEMPPDLRNARGIPVDYTREDRPYTPEQKAERHRQGEQHMFDQVTQHSACDSAVVLCGREHVEALAVRFNEAGHCVETYDLNHESRYIEDWLMHIVTS